MNYKNSIAGSLLTFTLYGVSHKSEVIGKNGYLTKQGKM